MNHHHHFPVLPGLLLIVLMSIALISFARSGHSEEVSPDIDVLKAQRNGAMDAVAQMAGMLKAVQAAAVQREKDWTEYSSSLWKNAPEPVK